MFCYLLLYCGRLIQAKAVDKSIHLLGVQTVSNHITAIIYCKTSILECFRLQENLVIELLNCILLTAPQETRYNMSEKAAKE